MRFFLRSIAVLFYVMLAGCATQPRPAIINKSPEEVPVIKAEEGLLRLRPLTERDKASRPPFTSFQQSAQPLIPQRKIASIDALLAEHKQQALQKQLERRVQKEERDFKLKIALLSPQSRLPKLSKSFRLAAELALFDSNNPNVELLFFDSGRFPEDAQKAVSRAIDADADVILGPLFGDSVAASSSLARRAGIPMISFSNSSHLANPGVYIFGPAPDEQITSIVEFALSRENTNIALFVPSNDYGRILEKSTRESLAKNGRELHYLGYYNPRKLDTSWQVRQLVDFDQRRIQAEQAQRKLRSSLDDTQEISAQLKRLSKRDTVGAPPFNALIIGASNDQTLRTISSLFSYYDAGHDFVSLYGLQNWDNFNGLENESALRNASYTSLKTPDTDRLFNRISAISKKDTNALAPLIYDATVLSIVASDDDLLEFDVLEKPSGFEGITGRFRFHSDGRVERLYAITQITARGRQELQEASSFFMTP